MIFQDVGRGCPALQCMHSALEGSGAYLGPISGSARTGSSLRAMPHGIFSSTCKHVGEFWLAGPGTRAATPQSGTAAGQGCAPWHQDKHTYACARSLALLKALLRCDVGSSSEIGGVPRLGLRGR